jgi:hypothetical protein
MEETMSDNRRQAADERLALELAGGATLKTAAESARVSIRTATRRRAEPAFRKRELELRGEMVNQALSRLANASAAAAAVVTRVMLEAEESETRLKAARTLLELLVKVREHTQIDARLADFERRLEFMKDRGRRFP